MPSSACSSLFSWSSRLASASSAASPSASSAASSTGFSTAGGSSSADGSAVPAAAGGRRAAASLLCLVLAGLLWGTGGLTGTLLGRAAGLPPLSVAALRLLGGGALIVVFRIIPGRRWPAGRAAWTRV